MTRKDALLYQNARFYEAFERSSIDMMEEIWSDSPRVRCVHPGWSVVEGRSAVLESWQRIFDGEVKMKVSLRNVKADVYGSIGVVVLQEEVFYTSGKLSNSGSVIATNIFEHDGKNWKMIHHHGSPTVVVEEQEGENFRYN
ncbi:MAG TPA: nuclear transport factor 2 family protein [Bacteroidota bacterium]|nr:nuclear transport factor 2 family protein [Bacteroidota bacterium]